MLPNMLRDLYWIATSHHQVSGSGNAWNPAVPVVLVADICHDSFRLLDMTNITWLLFCFHGGR